MAPTPDVPPTTQPDAAPAASPKGISTAQDGATASLTPASSSKGKDDAAVESTRQVANPSTPSTSVPPASTPSEILEGIDLSGIEDTTLTNDFQVGRHVSSRFLFIFCALFVRCATSAPDRSSPRVYGWLRSEERRVGKECRL